MTYDAAIAGAKPVQLAEHVFRITAPNPGQMTGPGTNTYVVGSGDDQLVIDPGPAIPAHIEAIQNHVGDNLQAVVVTHTHSDHSPAAAVLKSRLNCAVWGLPSTSRLEMQFQDATFSADRVLNGGERIDTSAGVLRVIHTPGHVSNHLCFLLEESGLLFAGDHIMQGSTVAIVPPQGSMGDYLQSLELLKACDVEAIAPAHGLVIKEPLAEIDRLIEHRLWRERKVLSGLDSEARTLDELLPVVYDDVPESLHWAAKFSLFAHLQKLQQDLRATASFDVVLESPESLTELNKVQWRLA